MAAPPRGNTGYSTYFITSSAFQKNSLFQSERMAQLFIDVLFHYRDQKNYLLHEFVLMPDHFHLLITPTLSLERALQLIKGRLFLSGEKGIGIQRRNLGKRLLRPACKGYRRFPCLSPIHSRESGQEGLGVREPGVQLQFSPVRVCAGRTPSAAKAGGMDSLNRSAEALRHPKSMA
jgi:REP element-mobilizing transposase RayT